MYKENDTDSKAGYIPTFHRHYLHPKYWGMWVAAGALAGLSYLPVKLRDPMLAGVGRIAGRFAKGGRRRALINLYYCFPDMPKAERERITDEMFASAPHAFVMLAELCLRNPQRVISRTQVHGQDIIDALQAEGRNIIFMVPHGWAIDLPAMLFAAQEIKWRVCSITRKPVADYLWNKARFTSADVCTPAKPVSNRSLPVCVMVSVDIICRTRITAKSTVSLCRFSAPIKPHSLLSGG